jgi:hypothetical protein
VGACSGGCATDAGAVDCEAAGEGCVRKAGEVTCSVEASGTPCSAGADCVEPTPDTTVAPCVATDPATDAPTCPPPVPDPEVEPPEEVTPPDAVAGVARGVVAAAGLPVDGAIVTGTHLPAADGEGPGRWFLTVELRLEGLPSGLVSFIEVVEGGQVLSGHGVLGTLDDLGGYPLLDTRAAIDRANAHLGQGAAPGIAADSGSSRGAAGASDPGAASTAGGTDGGSATDVGGATGGDDPVTTVVDPCGPPEGASDGCGGTTGCGGDGCTAPDGPPDTTTTIPCQVQPDGTELCEAVDPCAVEQPQATTTLPCVPDCPQDLATDDVAVGAPDVVDCMPPIDPVPEPEPMEIVLVDAARSLVPLFATDGSAIYLVPAYRFTAEDGGQVDLPAVADEALTGTASTDTTVPATDVPAPPPEPRPQPCEVLEEGDASGTTHTVQTCAPPDEDPRALGPGEEPAIGVGYYVDVDTECVGGSFVLGDQVWITDDDAPGGWGDDQHEGGTFTLDSPDHGTFVGDAAKTKVGAFRTLPPNEDIFCTPEPR